MFDKMLNVKLFKNELLISFLLSLGVILGAIYVSFISNENLSKASEYLTLLFSDSEAISLGEIKGAFIQYLIIYLLIAFSASVFFGAIVNSLAVIYRGFVTGYTSACFIKLYGIKGILIFISVLPELLIFLPALVVFSSISLKMSVLSSENKKLKLKKFFKILIIFLAIFCGLSLFQGFVTTIFMKWAAKLL